MTCQSYVNTLIQTNNWNLLEEFLLTTRGVIGRSAGGRYCYHIYQGYLDLNQLCLRIYDVSRMDSFSLLPTSDRLTVSRVVQLLRVLHDQTEEALFNASYVESIATRLYDFREKIYVGFLPIERLENGVLPSLDVAI